jgi:hypothetical protein
MRKALRYVTNLLYALDLLFNAITAGDPRETMSSRMGKAKRDRDSRIAHFLCGLLHVDPFHCLDAINDDVGSRALTRAVWPIVAVYILGFCLLVAAGTIAYKWLW